MKWTKIIFEENGQKCKTFDSQEEIINSEREEKLDCILNDLQMPDFKSVKIEIVPEYDYPVNSVNPVFIEEKRTLNIGWEY
jgi:hypothetical protein